MKNKKRGPKYSPFSKDFYIYYKGLSEEEAIFEAKSNRPLNVEYWIKRGFSKEDAKKEISEFQKEQSKKFQKKRKENPQKYRDIYTNQKDYWIKKGFSEEDAEKKVRERGRKTSHGYLYCKSGYDLCANLCKLLI